MSVVAALAVELARLGLGTYNPTGPSTITRSHMPAGTDLQIAVLDRGGRPEGTGVDRRDLRVVARGPARDHVQAEQAANSARDLLDSQYDTTWAAGTPDETAVVGVTVGPATFDGPDRNGQDEWSIRVVVLTEHATPLTAP